MIQPAFLTNLIGFLTGCFTISLSSILVPTLRLNYFQIEPLKPFLLLFYHGRRRRNGRKQNKYADKKANTIEKCKKCNYSESEMTWFDEELWQEVQTVSNLRSTVLGWTIVTIGFLTAANIENGIGDAQSDNTIADEFYPSV